MHPPDLQIQTHANGRDFTLLQPFSYISKDGYEFTVPRGYVFDFASVPKILWSIYPPLGRYNVAALLHDWLYDTHHANIHMLERSFCDDMFLEVMKLHDVGVATRYPMYYAVRVAGGAIWNRSVSYVEISRTINLYEQGGNVCGIRI